jgi:hypothetical protein
MPPLIQANKNAIAIFTAFFAVFFTFLVTWRYAQFDIISLFLCLSHCQTLIPL